MASRCSHDPPQAMEDADFDPFGHCSAFKDDLDSTMHSFMDQEQQTSDMADLDTSNNTINPSLSVDDQQTVSNTGGFDSPGGFLQNQREATGDLAGSGPPGVDSENLLLDPPQLNFQDFSWDFNDVSGCHCINGPSSSKYPETLSDFPQLHRTHHTSGYSEGLSAARTDIVQPAFDAVFPAGMGHGIRAGKVLGCIEFALAGRTEKEESMIMHAARRELNMDQLIPDVMTEIRAGSPSYTGWPTDDVVTAAWAQVAGRGDGTADVYPNSGTNAIADGCGNAQLESGAGVPQLQSQQLQQAQDPQQKLQIEAPPSQQQIQQGYQQPAQQQQPQQPQQPQQQAKIHQKPPQDSQNPQNPQQFQQSVHTPPSTPPQLPTGLLVNRYGPPANVPGYRGYVSPALNIGEAILRWELLVMDFVNFRKQSIGMGIDKRTGSPYC